VKESGKRANLPILTGGKPPKKPYLSNLTGRKGEK